MWSDADTKIPALEEDIARMNALQAQRDKAYNLARANASKERYEKKLALRGSYPNAEDIALYARARHILAYSPPPSDPQEPAPVAAIGGGRGLHFDGIPEVHENT